MVSVVCCSRARSGTLAYRALDKLVCLRRACEIDIFLPHCGNSSVGRAQPCQGWGRGFESRFPLSYQRSTGDGSPKGFPFSPLQVPGWRKGRREGLKIPFRQRGAGSIPAPGISASSFASLAQPGDEPTPLEGCWQLTWCSCRGALLRWSSACADKIFASRAYHERTPGRANALPGIICKSCVASRNTQRQSGFNFRRPDHD